MTKKLKVAERTMAAPATQGTAHPAISGAAHLELLKSGSTIGLREAATVLGISHTTAYRLAEDDEFPVPLLRAGRRYLVPTQPMLEALGLANADFAATAEARS